MVALSSWIEKVESAVVDPFSRPGEADPHPKNRVGDFFRDTPNRVGEVGSQVVDRVGFLVLVELRPRQAPSLARSGEENIEWGTIKEGTNPDGSKYTYQEGPIEQRKFRHQHGFRRRLGNGRYVGRNRWSTVTIKARHVLFNGTDHQLHFIGGNVNFKGADFGFGIAGGPLSVGLGIAQVGYIRVTPLQTDGTLNVHFDVFKKFEFGGGGGVGPVGTSFPEKFSFGDDFWYSGQVSFELP